MYDRDSFDHLVNAYDIHNVPLLISSAFCFAFGFMEYIYSFLLVVREHRAPYPIWMHTFYFAHDSSWAVRLMLAAPKYDWNWFLTATSIALFVWVGFECFCLFMAVKVERQEIWGPYSRNGEVTKLQAFGYIVRLILAFYILVNLFIRFVGQGCLFEWFSLTNVLMATAPGELWRRRGSRYGTSVGLALVIVVATIHTFAPTSMFVMAVPEVFDSPIYYLAGLVFTAISIENAFVVWQYPEKIPLKDGRRPIW